MTLKALTVTGYRSIQRVNVPLGQITVAVGENGVGKTNLYRGLVLLQAAATGRLPATLADEGGFASALWAGRRRKGPVRMIFEATWDDLAYRLELGLPQPPNPFPLDPVIKVETISVPEVKAVLAERGNGSAFVRDENGDRVVYPFDLWPSESMLTQILDPRRLPILTDIRGRLLDWRTYHQVRTDADSPLRMAKTGCFTPVMSADGSDLAAALATIVEIGDRDALAETIDRAFGGSRLIIDRDSRGQFLVMLERPGLQRALSPAELSDGTLRYLALAAALLSPRPPELMAINEPETSLHSELLDPLAVLIRRAARRTQVWVTTHSTRLSVGLGQRGETEGSLGETVSLDVTMTDGQTHVSCC